MIKLWKESKKMISNEMYFEKSISFNVLWKSQ